MDATQCRSDSLQWKAWVVRRAHWPSFSTSAVCDYSPDVDESRLTEADLELIQRFSWSFNPKYFVKKPTFKALVAPRNWLWILSKNAVFQGYYALVLQFGDYVNELEAAQQEDEPKPEFEWDEALTRVRAGVEQSVKDSEREWLVQGVRTALVRWTHDTCSIRTAWKLLKSQFHSALRKLAGARSYRKLFQLPRVWIAVGRGQLINEGADTLYRLASVPLSGAWDLWRGHRSRRDVVHRLPRQFAVELIMASRAIVTTTLLTGAIVNFYFVGGLLGCDTDAAGQHPDKALPLAWSLMYGGTLLLDTSLAQIARMHLEVAFGLLPPGSEGDDDIGNGHED